MIKQCFSQLQLSSSSKEYSFQYTNLLCTPNNVSLVLLLYSTIYTKALDLRKFHRLRLILKKRSTEYVIVNVVNPVIVKNHS